ncbi:MAG: carbohydrate-binding protein, partial [Tepidisphaeraceae bacterium]
FQSVVSILPIAGNPPRSVVIELIRDDDADQQRDAGEVLVSTAAFVSGSANAPGVINTALLVPATYYLRVQRNAGDVSYNLSLGTTSLDTAGNSLGTPPAGTPPAASLGTLTGTINSAGELLASLSGDEVSLNIEVIRNVDNDTNIDPGETLATSAGFVGANDRLNGVFLPVAGDYFVRVLTPGSDSAYALSLTFSTQTPFAAAPFQISNTAATKIEVENFDNGGEGVAYHDTDPADGPANGVNFRSNEGVDIRNTSDAGGGFRLATTKLTEFLEYTIFVNQSALYDFDFRVSSPGDNAPSNAAFHLEVDGTDVTGPMVIPNTGGVDSMTTITKTNVPLIAGPHILRLAIDTQTGGSPDIAGTYNFITVRPTPLTGTFDLTQSAIGADGHVRLGLTWTVPTGGWRVLKEVLLRLTDEAGDSLLIKFDEAANTFSLFNPQSGKYGPGKAPGSNGTLSIGFATLHLRTTSVQASGPTDPSVLLSLDISFSNSVRGRHFIIEAAASDDLGHNDIFLPAGVLLT